MFALEAGLDHEAGGEVAHTLARLYADARRTIVEASIGSDPTPFREVASTLDEIGEAWRTVRAG
jgi:flagellar protein FliS